MPALELRGAGDWCLCRTMTTCRLLGKPERRRGPDRRLAGFQAQLLSNHGVANGAIYSDGDLDKDGDVDLADLAALLGVYNNTCE